MIDSDLPALEMVLGALVTHPQHLTSLALTHSQESTLRMAATFASLATLGLSATDSTDKFDISALQDLPHLHTLSLYTGHFCTQELPKGLSSLQLDDATLVLDLGEPTTCVVPLQKWKVIRSHWSSIHSNGILAYTTLQELYLDNGSIDSICTSEDSTELIEFGECGYGSFRCPDLSALKFMRVLYVNVSGPANDEPIDWGCLYCLSSLQVLTLHSTTQGMKIDQNLTVLGNLSCLTLIGAALTYANVVSVAINVNWGAMPSLQNIRIESDGLQFGSNMLELLQVSGLRRVTFLDSKRVTAGVPADFAALLQGLIMQRPEVILIVNGSRKLAV